MKILLLGKDGQVGWELQRSLSALGQVIAMSRNEADLEDINKLKGLVKYHRPEFIVNAAAYTAVDKAETEPETAYLINSEAVQALAEEADRLNSWLIHYSTDYVFDGNKDGAYLESDIAQPLSVYGKSKLAGEDAIRGVGSKHLIIRSSWVYSVYGSNFPLAILRRALEREQIEVVADAFGAPTSAHLIGDVTALVLHRLMQDQSAEDFSGTYHLTPSGVTSWYEYAQLIIRLARKRGLPLKVAPNRVFPVGSDTYKSLAQRPRNSRLDNTKISDQFKLRLPDWESHVARFVDEVSKARPI